MVVVNKHILKMIGYINKLQDPDSPKSKKVMGKLSYSLYHDSNQFKLNYTINKLEFTIWQHLNKLVMVESAHLTTHGKSSYRKNSLIRRKKNMGRLQLSNIHNKIN